MKDVYRQPAPMPPPSIEYGESSLYVAKADILFRCEHCKAEWRFSNDVFNLSDASEGAAFRPHPACLELYYYCR